MIRPKRCSFLGVLLLPVGQCLTGLLTVCYVELQQFSVSVGHLQCALGFCLVADVVDEYFETLSGQSYGDGASDAAAAACY